MLKKFKITDPEVAGGRVDVFVARELPQYPRSVLAKLFDTGHILVNQKTEKLGYKLRVGDSVSVDISTLVQDAPILDLPVIYEDRDVLVVDKPAGVLSHDKGAFRLEGSVASFVRYKEAGMSGERAGIVHRLDRATSGVMITAKNEATQKYLQKQFSDRKVQKTYFAVVKGVPKQPEALIDMPIGRDPQNAKRFTVMESGKKAQTRYKLTTTNGRFSLLELKPTTGRTHQIRIHLQAIGLPIVGDTLYGGEAATRLMLHAQQLEINLPGGVKRSFTSPLPSEFDDLVL